MAPEEKTLAWQASPLESHPQDSYWWEKIPSPYKGPSDLLAHEGPNTDTHIIYILRDKMRELLALVCKWLSRMHKEKDTL